MLFRVRYFWLWASTFVAAAAACAGSAPSARAPEPTAKLRSLPTHTRAASSSLDEAEPRLFPPLSGLAVSAVGEDKDGSKRIVSYGLRVLARPGGALELAKEYLPTARSVRALEMPARLGGGFLFYVQSSNATLFFRAATFTGELEPFARLDFEADHVIAGFDRIYVLANRPDRIVALDAERGNAVGLGSLPASPSYGKMAFVDGWFGALAVPLRGALVSFDAGGSWHSLGMNPSAMAEHDGALRLTGPDGVYDLDRTGAFKRRDQAASPAPRENAVAQALRAGSTSSGASSDALKLAVLRGFRDADGSLVVANSGMLRRIRASDGKLLESDEHAYPGGGECNALNYGTGSAFACNDGANRTALYTFEAPLRMRHVRTFGGPRYVSASGNGALVIRGTCGASDESAPGAYCIARKNGEFSEIRVRGDAGVERVVALADGRVAVIVPPRLGAAGFLSLIDANGNEQRRALELPTSARAPLLEKGLWLDGFVEAGAGVLAGWVVGSEPFAGVRVALDGKVTVAHSETSIDRALLSADRALLIGRTGRARESTDGGFEWSDVELPSEFDAGRELSGESRLQGCSRLGCAFAGFVRLGWRTGKASPRLRIADLPESTPQLQPGGSRWVLNCEASSEVSEPSLPPVTRERGAARTDDALAAPWSPFLDLPAPALGPGEVGFDVASGENEGSTFRAYAWGERGADWTRVGHLQLRLSDRFQVRRGAYQSAVTRSPWPDATTAAEAFGFDGTGNPSSWRAVLDSTQRAAAVLVSSRGLLDLLLFEEGKTVTRIANAGRLGFNFGMVSSVAKSSDAWYLASFNENHSLVLSKISGGRVERIADYPDPAHDIASATLVHGLRGEDLGIWATGRGWFLFPIDGASHALQAPLAMTPADLAVMPPPCAPDADGFLLTGAPSLEPNLRLSAASGGDTPSARRVEAQFIWSARGLCTRALAAETEGAIKRTGATGPSSTVTRVPLTVSERRPQGRRWGYLCAP